MRTLPTLRALATALVLSAPALAADDPPATRLFTASDLPGLAEQGVKLPRSGEYTLKVWGSDRQEWSLASDGQVLTLSVRTQGNRPRTIWRTVGKAKLSADSPVTIKVAGARFTPPTIKGDYQSGTTTTEAKAQSSPLPALLVLTTDPNLDLGPALDLIRGRTDTARPPADPRRTTVRTNHEGADFHAPASAQEWHDRAKAVREQLLVALGLRPMFPRTELHPRIFGKVERDGYTIEKVVLETFPGFTLSGNLYRPVGKSGKLPAVLCPHGHWSDGRVNPEVQPRCIHWAKLGCVVFLYDMVGYNDSKPFGHSFLDDRLRRWGLSLATLQTWDSIRALDWISTLPDVDPTRIGCTGESGGGTQTFLLTALDDRIKVAAPVVMVSDSFQGGCVCENAAGLRIGTDNVEFAALAAPRPLKLVGARGDWTALTMRNAYPAIRDVYRLVGSPDRVSADVFAYPHNYNQTSRNAVYAFMAHWLLGIDDSESTREGPQTLEKPEDLRTFDDAHPAPPGRKTAAQLETELVGVLGRQVDKLAPRTDAAAWEAGRAVLMSALKARVGLVNPAPADLSGREERRASRDGVTIVHSLVGRRPSGEQIPVVRLIPTKPTGRLTVVLHPRGKAGLATPEGQPAPLVKALLDRGQSVVGFDPLLIGESFDPTSPATRRPETAHYDTYNPALAADRMQDLATVLAWARAQPDVLEVSLVGRGTAGPLALLARPALEGLARTAVDLHEFDYGDGSGDIPAGLDLPGVLQFGALKAAAALTAPAPLRIDRAGPAFAASWPQKAYALADATPLLHLNAGTATPEDVAKWIDTGE
jgi:dienelactone hydrolase